MPNQFSQTDPQPWWRTQRGPGAVVATAIHDGSGLREDVRAAMLLDVLGRLREEDPFTGQAVEGVANHIIGCRSRFEFDLNRARDVAFYRTPEQCWGLNVWHKEPGDAMVAESFDLHDAFYAMMAETLDDVAARHERFVVLDCHSYNHRRDGPDAAPTAQDKAPDINIGTFSMPREQWAWLLDPLIETMRSHDFAGRRLDVRENVAFQGKGELTRFVHDRYPGKACAIAIEFKKFFMDEWTGEPDPTELKAMRGFIDHIAVVAQDLLDGR